MENDPEFLQGAVYMNDRQGAKEEMMRCMQTRMASTCVKIDKEYRMEVKVTNWPLGSKDV